MAMMISVDKIEELVEYSSTDNRSRITAFDSSNKNAGHLWAVGKGWWIGIV